MKYELAVLVPALFPRPLLLVYFTGVLEFMGAVGLLWPRFRALAGISLIARLIVLISRQWERGAEGNDAARQTANSAMVADSHAAAVYRPSLVVHPPRVDDGILVGRQMRC